MGYFEGFIGVNLWTALFVLLNTVTVIVVATKFLFKPVMQMIADRQKEIDDLYDDAGKAKAAAESMQEAYAQKLAGAIDTGERIVKEAVERGRNREEEIIRNANREADTIREKANADISREKRKAVNDAKNEISGIAMAIAEKVVGRELNASDQADIVDSFIAQLGDPS